jgi:adenosylcobinamide amidohydrolase
MLLGRFYDTLEISRQDKIIVARFLKPHLVVSTCRAAGGMQQDLKCIYNHQSCEPTGHTAGLPKSAYQDPEEYRRLVCQRYDLEPESCATLGTAANMNNATIASESFRAQQVVAVCTGGVETNAGRVGDPAFGYEEDGKHIKLSEPQPPAAGTINTMLFFNRELTPGALVRSLVTATEAKTSVLQELAVNSRYSPELATGTGTDQIAAACLLDTGAPLTGAGKHSKLGELIGRAVHKAIKQTLAIQNELTPAGQCSARVHLERFGGDRESFTRKICAHLTPGQARLFRDNYDCINRDPMTVAAVAALAHMRDKLAWGVLPAYCRPEVLANFAAQIAAAVSGDYESLADYRQTLALTYDQDGDREVLALACRALALGFSQKWEHWPEAE